jgi:hypothetical protein
MSNTQLPTPGGDSGNWGTYLNNFLSVAHVASTSASASNGYLSAIVVATFASSPVILTGNPGRTVLANATAGAITVTLPDATTTFNFYTIKKTDATGTVVTVNTTSSQTIDGGSTASLKVQYVSITVASDGSNWYVI